MQFKGKEVSEFDKKVLDKIASKLMSISGLAKELKQDRQFTRGVCESLLHRGLLKRTQVGKSTVYQIEG